MKNILILLPEIFLSLVALGLLVLETVIPNKNRLFVVLSTIALVITGVYVGCFFWHTGYPFLEAAGIKLEAVNAGWSQYPLLFNMISVDSLAVFFKISIIAAVILIFWLSMDYPEYSDVPMGTYSGLLLLATVGMMLLVSSVDLLMAVIALELLSITSFILTGFIFERRSSSEAAIKFFLVGSLSTAIFLFGISYYYGIFGTTSITPLLVFATSGWTVDQMLIITISFILAGIGFKLAMVPFHMWAPDAYEGAPTPITAFLSVAPKAAALGFLARFLSSHASLEITQLLAILAAITMTVGNVGAIQQRGLKRLLAYSSIAQVGYILVALVAGQSIGTQAVMIYTLIYIFMNLGVFAVVTLLSNARGSDDIEIFAGLAKTNFGMAFLTVLFLLSMAGIPPLAGFIGKFAIFSAVISDSSLVWLAVVAVVNSVISLYYYFRIVHQMFFVEPSTNSKSMTFTPLLVSGLVVCMGVTLYAGLMPNQLLLWVKSLVGA